MKILKAILFELREINKALQAIASRLESFEEPKPVILDLKGVSFETSEQEKLFKEELAKILSRE